MIYRSNLAAPDLTGRFKLKDPPLLTMGHDMPSDPDYDPGCGFLTHDEGAILCHIVKAWPYRWVDIGARFGWSTANIAAAQPLGVIPVDPILAMQAQSARFEANTGHCWDEIIEVAAVTSESYFSRRLPASGIQGAMIDGCHDTPEPTLDADRAVQAGAHVLVWHDFQGKPVRDAVMKYIERGWKARAYDTPNGLAVAWVEGFDFQPPLHVPDPAIDWAQIRSRYSDFDYTRTI